MSKEEALIRGDRSEKRQPSSVPWLPILTGLALLLGVILRLSAVDADPPPFLSTDFGDEATWAFAARNRFLLGAWTCGPYNLAYYAAPLFSWISYFSMRAAGLTLWAIRFPAALAGIGSLLLFWGCLRRTWDPPRAQAATIWFALNQFHIAHSRVGLVETTTLFLEMMVWACLYIRGRWAAALAGVLLGINLLVKGSAAQDLPAIALLFAVGWLAERRQPIDAGYFLIGSAGFVEAFYWIHPVSFDAWAFANLILAGWGPTSTNVPGFFGSPALLWLLVPVAGSVIYLFSLREHSDWRGICRERTVEAYATVVFVGNAAAIAFNFYSPERRFLILTPAVIVLAVAAGFEMENAARRAIGIAAAAATSLLVVRAAWTGAFFYFLLFRASTLQFPPHFFRLVLLAALALAVPLRKLRLTAGLAWCACAAALLFELALGATWILRPTYREREAFTAIASLPYNGPLLTTSHGEYVALAFPGCLRLESDRYPVYFLDTRYAFYLRADFWRPPRFAPPLLVYHSVEWRGALPGSQLIRSFNVVTGDPPRARLWLWQGPGRKAGRERCCNP